MSATLLRATKTEKIKFRKNYSPIKFRRWEGSLTIPKGLTPLEHQVPCAKYALNRNRSYLRLDPGLGKTPIAALITQGMGCKTLYVCPAMLVQNVYEEFKKWNPTMSVKVLDNIDWIVPEVLIIPDSIIDRYETRLYIRTFKPEVIIIDEAHRFKNLDANRTQALLGYKDKDEGYIPGIVDRRDLKNLIYLTGTPMPNRPIELYPIISKSCPEYIDFQNYIQYGLRYCKGYYDGHGYDFRGANKEELELLKGLMLSKNWDDRYGFMLKLEKAILKLPPLIEEVVILGDGKPSRELRSIQNELFKKYSADDLINFSTKKKFKSKDGKDDKAHFATYRRLLGLEKVPFVADYIKDILENSDENILLLGIHVDVIKELGDRLSDYKPFVVTGDTVKASKRHDLVKEYQRDKKRPLFISNIDAIGVGHTITKASRVPLCEWSPVPGTNRQGIDRVHRYGLKHSVLAEFIALANSKDIDLLKSLQKKEKITAII